MDFVLQKIKTGQASLYVSIVGAALGAITLSYGYSGISGHLPIAIEESLFLAMPASFFVAFLFAGMTLLDPPYFKRPLTTYVRIIIAAAIAMVTLIPFAVIFLRLLREND